MKISSGGNHPISKIPVRPKSENTVRTFADDLKTSIIENDRLSESAQVFSMRDYLQLKQQFTNISTSFEETKHLIHTFRGINPDSRNKQDYKAFLDIMNTFADAGFLLKEDIENMQTCIERPELLNSIQPARSSDNIIEALNYVLEFELKQKQAIETLHGKIFASDMQAHIDSLQRTTQLLDVLLSFE